MDAAARRRFLIGATAVAIVLIAGVGYFGNQMAEQQRIAAEQNRLAVAAIEAGPVSVPVGEFLMGSIDADSSASNDEKPQHKVYLDAFRIDRTKVTNALYAKCVQAGKCPAPANATSSTRSSYYGNSQYDNYPVIYVAWDDARKYCEFAGGRLPTEAEWEKAARGTDGRIYPWGNEPPDAKRANFDNNVKDTTPVGSFLAGASPYGALDMAGNVWEWVADWYDEKYYGSSSSRNPSGPSSGQVRVLRGGAWLSYQSYVRAADRFWYAPDYRLSYLGFRCARSP